MADDYATDAWASVQFRDVLQRWHEASCAEADAAYAAIQSFCREHDKCVTIPAAGTPVEQQLYNEAMAEIERLNVSLAASRRNYRALAAENAGFAEDLETLSRQLHTARVEREVLRAEVRQLKTWIEGEPR